MITHDTANAARDDVDGEYDAAEAHGAEDSHHDSRNPHNAGGLSADTPIRYIIVCRTSIFGHDINKDVELIEELVKQQDLNHGNLVHLGTSLCTGRVHIALDYNNPTHSQCTIRTFRRGKRHIRAVHLPESLVDYANKRVEDWQERREKWRKDFPIRDEVYACSKLLST